MFFDAFVLEFSCNVPSDPYCIGIEETGRDERELEGLAKYKDDKSIFGPKSE